LLVSTLDLLNFSRGGAGSAMSAAQHTDVGDSGNAFLSARWGAARNRGARLAKQAAAKRAEERQGEARAREVTDIIFESGYHAVES
jgi:hypothetical protein